MDPSRLTRCLCQLPGTPEGSERTAWTTVTVADQYPMSREGLAALHQAIQQHGERQVGLDCGHPPIMAARAAHWHYQSLKRELGIDDPAAL